MSLYIFFKFNLCISAANQVQILEAEECNKIIDGLCYKGGDFRCKINCKAICNSFSASGECGKEEDKDCHCKCC